MKVMIDDVQYVPAPEPIEGKGLDAALAIRFDSDAGDQITVRQYFEALLLALWEEGEGFSGKRPFGNGGWEYEIFRPLAKAGFIDATIDHENDDVEFTKEQLQAADKYVADLIRFVCKS